MLKYSRMGQEANQTAYQLTLAVIAMGSINGVILMFGLDLGGAGGAI